MQLLVFHARPRTGWAGSHSHASDGLIEKFALAARPRGAAQVSLEVTDCHIWLDSVSMPFACHQFLPRLWQTSVTTSPYTDVDPLFGSMADLDGLKTGHIATNSKSFSTWSPISLRINTPGLLKAKLRATTRRATGIFGAIRAQTGRAE